MNTKPSKDKKQVAYVIDGHLELGHLSWEALKSVKPLLELGHLSWEALKLGT